MMGVGGVACIVNSKNMRLTALDYGVAMAGLAKQGSLQFDGTTYIKAAWTQAQPVSILLVARCDTFVSSRDFCDGGATTDSDDFLGTGRMLAFASVQGSSGKCRLSVFDVPAR